MSSEKHLSVSEAARAIGAKPEDISSAFYKRQLRDDIAPIIAGRRCIPVSYLEVVRMVLKRAGKPVDSAKAVAVA